MRKIICILFSVLLIVLMAVPALAAGSGDVFYYLPLQFDSFIVGDSRYSWEGNYIGTFTDELTVDAGNYTLVADYFTNNLGQPYATLEVYSPWTFTLYSSGQLVNASALRELRVGFGYDLNYAATIVYSFNVQVMESVNNIWVLRSIPLSGSFSVGSGAYFPLGNMLFQEVRRVYDGALIRISDLYLTFNIANDGGNTEFPQTSFTSRLAPNFNEYLPAWLESFSMESLVEYTVVDSSGNVNVTSWLSSTLAGVWDFEFIPGFSLGDIALILFGLGILVVFFKVFGG